MFNLLDSGLFSLIESSAKVERIKVECFVSQIAFSIAGLGVHGGNDTVRWIDMVTTCQPGGCCGLGGGSRSSIVPGVSLGGGGVRDDCGAIPWW